MYTMVAPSPAFPRLILCLVVPWAITEGSATEHPSFSVLSSRQLGDHLSPSFGANHFNMPSHSDSDTKDFSSLNVFFADTHQGTRQELRLRLKELGVVQHEMVLVNDVRAPSCFRTILAIIVIQAYASKRPNSARRFVLNPGSGGESYLNH